MVIIGKSRKGNALYRKGVMMMMTMMTRPWKAGDWSETPAEAEAYLD